MHPLGGVHIHLKINTTKTTSCIWFPASRREGLPSPQNPGSPRANARHSVTTHYEKFQMVIVENARPSSLGMENRPAFKIRFSRCYPSLFYAYVSSHS